MAPVARRGSRRSAPRPQAPHAAPRDTQIDYRRGHAADRAAGMVQHLVDDVRRKIQPRHPCSDRAAQIVQDPAGNRVAFLAHFFPLRGSIASSMGRLAREKPETGVLPALVNTKLTPTPGMEFSTSMAEADKWTRCVQLFFAFSRGIVHMRLSRSSSARSRQATSSRLCAVRIKSRTSGPNGRPPAAHAYRAIAVRDR